MCEHSRCEFVPHILRLVRANPSVFYDALAEAYEDVDNPGHDDVGSVLPALGNWFVDSPLLEMVHSETQSKDRKTVANAVRVLARTMAFCDGARRDKMMSAVAESIAIQRVNRLLRHEEIGSDFINWLVEKLRCDNALHAFVAAGLLMGLDEFAASEGQRRRVISLDTKSLPSEFFLSLQPGTDGWVRSLARASVGSLRMFRIDGTNGIACKIGRLASWNVDASANKIETSEK